MSHLDPLSDVLRSVRLRGSVFFHVSCRDEWAAQAPHSSAVAPAAMPGDPKPIPITYRGSMFEPGSMLPAGDASTVIVCGFIACDLRPFNPLIAALPRLLHLPAEGVGTGLPPAAWRRAQQVT